MIVSKYAFILSVFFKIRLLLRENGSVKVFSAEQERTRKTISFECGIKGHLDLSLGIRVDLAFAIPLNRHNRQHLFLPSH